MSIIKKESINNIKKNLIFILIYTLVFVLIYKTFKFIAPFFIGGAIAILINPISSKLKSKFNINKGISTIVLSFLAVMMFISLTAIIIITSLDNIIAFTDNLANNYDNITEIISKLNININTYMEKLQNIPNIDIQYLVDKYSTKLMIIIRSILENTIAMLTSIPYIAIFTLTLFMATYFIAKDIDKIENRFYNMFTEPTRTKVKNIKTEIIKSAIGYIRAYTILMGITFIVTWICFRFFKIPYTLPLALVAAILDLIPFLGIVVVYLPFIIYYWIVNELAVAIGLAMIFLLLSILREILEPKLVSMNIGIGPLATLGAIFIGVQLKGIIGIIFFLGLIVMHKILKKVDIL
ncbi:MAG: sporulation integral membrane protein YtvI [Peptostreptococcaceae bacterium]